MRYQFMALTLAISSCDKIWTIQILNSEKWQVKARFFLTLNDVKWKSHEYQSFITHQDGQTLFRSFSKVVILFSKNITIL